MKPKAFLSYRHNLPPEIAGKAALIDAVDKQQKLELVYDKSVTEVGDSVTAFMEELIAARCVFLFISEDYFKSAYTLFELIAINEHPEVKAKIILPVCLSEQMLGVYDYSDIKSHWESHQETRDVLATLLQTSGISDGKTRNDDASWHLINKAWKEIVFGYLNTLRDNNATYSVNALIDQVVSKAGDESKIAIDGIRAHHRSLVLEEISFIFDAAPVIKDTLTKSSRTLRRLGSLENSEFAKHFLSDTGVASRSLGDLTSASKQIRDSVGKNSTEWRDLFQDIQQLCGCLLLNTIDPVWWFNNELELRRQAQHCVTASGYLLDHPAFVEVVISKELLSRGELHSPKFSHDPKGTGDVVPGRGSADDDYNNMLMFDAVNVNAVAHTLLAKIHQDLHKSTSAPNDIDGLMSAIKDRAEAYKNSSDQRPVYYIVSHDYLTQLKGQDWFSAFEKALKGNLQFICCSQDTLSDSGKAAVESQTLLLSAVGLLLDLNKD